MKNAQRLFSTQFHAHYRPLCLYALRFLEDVDLAEDVVQETFTTLWEKRDALPEINSFKSYLYTSVRNNCLMKLRSHRDFEDVEELQLLEENTEEERMERAELEAKLWQLIDELPEKRREFFLMAKRDGMPYKEIAEETGLSVKTVDNHVTRALKFLREKDLKVYLFFFA